MITVSDGWYATHNRKRTQPGLDQELRITFDPQDYEDNSDSCELWVPGSPLFPGAQSPGASSEVVAPTTSQFRQVIKE